ncbi:unnamed protein product [Gulo gulo]|uniref:Uncharacterized protein n=1 Tax=Gulo gulo TaxID=48420 RepID=A0A9X9PZ54_GULGU|nr:unnamed protein product [Gulo gulo]
MSKTRKPCPIANPTVCSNYPVRKEEIFWSGIFLRVSDPLRNGSHLFIHHIHSVHLLCVGY